MAIRVDRSREAFQARRPSRIEAAIGIATCGKVPAAKRAQLPRAAAMAHRKLRRTPDPAGSGGLGAARSASLEVTVDSSSLEQGVDEGGRGGPAEDDQADQKQQDDYERHEPVLPGLAEEAREFGDDRSALAMRGLLELQSVLSHGFSFSTD